MPNCKKKMARISRKLRGLQFIEQEEYEEDTSMSMSQEIGSSISQDVNEESDNKTIWVTYGGSRRKMYKPSLTEVFGLRLGERVEVKLDENNCPHSYSGYLLGAFVADLARNGKECPIHIERWNHPALKIPKIQMMEIIERKFKFPKEGRAWVLTKLNEAWRAHKCYLKGRYFCGKRIEDVLKNVPKEIEASQWSCLVYSWNSDKKIEEARNNSRNARKQIHFHTGGRKSIARKRKEMMDENDGKEPDRLTLWDATHKKKDGSCHNEETRNKMLEATHLLATRSADLEEVT